METSDFYSFWSGARLVGAGLYDPAETIQHSIVPRSVIKRFIRPPFMAWCFGSWASYPFGRHNILWFVLNVTAVLIFVRRWRFRSEAYPVCALFLPLGWSFGIGQDAPLMLLVVAAGTRLVEQNRELAGGAQCSTCARFKPHLFILMPRPKETPGASEGILACGSLLYLISSAVLGLNWPPAFFLFHAAKGKVDTIHTRLLGVADLLSRFGTPSWALPSATIGGATMVCRCTRKAAWFPSIALAVAAGVSFAPRALVYDASLFLPLLLLHFSSAG